MASRWIEVARCTVASLSGVASFVTEQVRLPTRNVSALLPIDSTESA
jgi:hypothetical protein